MKLRGKRMVLGAVGTGVITVGVVWFVVFGTMEQLGLALLLLFGAGLAAGSVALLSSGIVSLVGRYGKRRAKLLVGTACGIAALGAVYFFYWQPRQLMRNLEYRYNATDDEIRSLCHRTLLWNPDPHDEFVSLARVGDESSVPYIIWALKLMPETGAIDCTWDHGLKALNTITNNSPGRTRKAWLAWYAANKRRSPLEWWADGFSAEGYPVSSAGGEESIRNLLAVLGRTPWCQHERKRWLSVNARRMLNALGEAQVRAVMGKVLRGGTVQQRRGLAQYAHNLDRAEGEPTLLALLRDQDRSVRLYASGVLCSRQRKWLKNPGEFVLNQYEPGEISPDEFFAPPGKDVVAAKVASEHDYTPSDTVQSNIKAVAGSPAGTECIIRIDYDNTAYPRPATLSLEGRSSPSVRLVYSEELIISTGRNTNELRWLFDPDTDRLYVSIPAFTCMIDPKTGAVLWEMGFGTGNCDGLFLLGKYLVIESVGKLIVCDAARGAIVANFELEGRLFGDRLSIVNGRLRAQDSDNRLYIIELPQLDSPRTPETAMGIKD